MSSEHQLEDDDLDPETRRLVETVEANEAELAELLELLVSVQDLAADLAPELQTVVRENRGDLEALRQAVEKEETLRLLEKLGENADSFIEVLNRWDATHDLLEELLPELISVVRENRGDLEALRLAFEREETLVLLEKLGDNVDAFVDLLELLDATYAHAEALTPEGREPIRELERVVAGFADARRERDATADAYQFGRNLDNLVALTETVAQPEVARPLESALSAFEADAEEIQPVGLFGLLGVLRDSEVKLALGRLVEAARRLARATDGRGT
jgi:uncharacterized protein YjgD (DUF1641 family)